MVWRTPKNKMLLNETLLKQYSIKILIRNRRFGPKLTKLIFMFRVNSLGDDARKV